MDGLPRYQNATEDAVLAATGWSVLDLATEARNLRDGRVLEGQLVYEEVTRGESLRGWGPLKPTSPGLLSHRHGQKILIIVKKKMTSQQ